MIKGLVDSGVQKRQIYWEILQMIRSKYVEFLAVVGVDLTVNTFILAQRKHVLILDFELM